MAVAAPPSGLLDLEKELSCSICTDTLYQPLTLLDCLHTFCGSCLKVWFAWQATQALADQDDPSRRAHPYTCPSCRAHVRATRRDAKITTLLDMYSMANPGKGKSEEEKEEMDANYAPGMDVIPKLEEVVDRRMIEEVRNMSIREGRPGRAYERGHRHQGRSSVNGSNEHDERQQAAQLEHQSSLRSLISTDDVDPSTMEEEIMRQILEEGLLDGVDLASMTPEQQDQLSERIAEAYRRRHGTRTRTRPRRGTGEPSAQIRSRDPSRRREERSSSRTPRRSPAGSPAQSPRRPHARSTGEAQPSPRHATFQRDDLLQAYPTSRPAHQRRSSEGRRQTAPVEAIRATQTQAARSATDLSAPQPTSSRTRRASHGVSAVDSTSHRQVLRHTESPMQRSPVQSPPQSPPAVSSPPTTSARGESPRQSQSPSMAPSVVPFEHSADQHPHIVANASYSAGTQVTAPYHPRTSSTSGSNAIPGLGRLKAYPEPSISCDRCNKPNIEYDLHHNCSSCKDGKYNICHRCYLRGKGCLNWFGFGNSAWERYQSKGAPTAELPHVMVGSRYRRPRQDEILPGSPDAQYIMTREPSAKRRRIGAFCYSCHEYADDFFYECDDCNQGEWGYCKHCVNQGRCCTHSLLPLAWTGSRRQKTSQSDQDQGVQATFAPTPDPRMIRPFPPTKTGSTRQYRPLTITTTCDRCRRSISPNQSRFHCSQCNHGATEYCADCYSQIQQSAAIRREDGENGWRRCPRGHRMIVYYFQESPAGQLRVLLSDLVGGLFLKDEPDGAAGMAPTADSRRYQDGRDGQSVTTSRAAMQPQPGEIGQNGQGSVRFPPNGGVGKRCVARWSWIPEDGVVDELMFPKGGEITEVLDVNETWSEGSYAGQKGVFPTKYVYVLEFVTM